MRARMRTDLLHGVEVRLRLDAVLERRLCASRLLQVHTLLVKGIFLPHHLLQTDETARQLMRIALQVRVCEVCVQRF